MAKTGSAGVVRFVVASALVLLQAVDASAQSLRPGYGATPYSGGVTFRVWAPHATNVTVAGDFNGWSSTSRPLYLESATSGVWSVDVPGAAAGQNYKYLVNAPSNYKTDPRSRLINTANNDNSVVVNPTNFNWQGDSYSMTNSRDLVIYEAHVGTFVGPSGTFSTFTNKLDYLRDLGVSAIELMPVNEFPSATSWGYNPAYPFSIETSYGAPDALRQLVLRSHQSGIAMLLDVVHNHWDAGSSLWQFDGWSPDGVHGGQYFYNAEPYANTPWGPRPDYSTSQVCAAINDSFRMWLDEYGFDGFRWDAPSHIIYTTNGVYIPDGLQMISNTLATMSAEHPGTLNIAEDIKELSGFNSYWDLTFVWEIRSVLTQGDDSNRDMPTVARNVAGTFQRVIYTDSHDTAGDLNGGVRLPTAIYGAQAEGYYARKRSTLGAALIMTSPGTPMILQGQEMIETNQFSDTRGVDWARTNSFAGITRLYRDLIRLRRNLDGVSEGLLGDGCSTYQVDNVNKLIAYSRWNSGTTDRYTVVVANFANTTRTGYTINFPAAGTWYVHFNSDSTNYAADYGNAGSLEVSAAGSPAAGSIKIGPYSVLILSQTPRTGMLISDTASTDSPAGNGDGVLDPGETIRERIVLWNKSQLPATNVSAVLSALTPGVTVAQGSSTYASMGPDSSTTNSATFEYHLDSTLACGSIVSFELATAFNGQVLTNVLDHVVGQRFELPPMTNLFESTDTPKPIADASTTYSDLTINEPGDNVIGDVNVQIRINHTYDRDLTLALQHPDGSEVLLVNRRGGSGDNFGSGACGSATYAILDQSAGTSISAGSAPFANTYRPESTLNTFNGKPLNGTWHLRMRDSYSKNTGTNLCWSIRVVYEQQGYDCNSFSNRPPVATATQFVHVGYASTNITLNGTDADGQALAFETASAPAHGRLSAVDTSTWTAVYTPVHGYIGTDAFDFVASDGLTSSLPATIRVAVQAPPDSDGDGMPDAWEQTCFTNPAATLPDDDNDHDGMSNLDEYRVNTNPNDSNSLLRLADMAVAGGGYTLRWSSMGGTRYGVEFSPGVTDAFARISRPLLSEMDCSPKGTPTNMSFTDDFTLTPPPGSTGLRLYRVRVVDQ
jgi:1,4-alpha-glucan branching enzyme